VAEQLTLGDLIYRLGYQPGDEEAFIRDTQRLFDRAEGEAETGGKQAGNKFTAGFKSVFGGAALGSFLGTVMAQAFSRASQAVTSFVQQSVRDFASYEQGLVQLKLAGVENLAPVEAEIKKIAEASQVFSTVDISDAVGQLVKAGFSAEQALTLVGKSADLAASEVDAATGSFGNISDIAQQAGQVVRAFGLDFNQTGHVIDVVAKAAQDSSADISDLIDAVSRVAPNGKQAGLSIEQLAGSIAVLTNKGIPAEYAARGLRSMLQSLINPPAAVKKQFDDLGISLVDRHGNVRDFNTVLSRLYDVLQQGGKGAQILGDGLGNVAVTIASSLGQSSNDVNQFSDNLVNADGSAKKLADTVRDSTAAELAAMQARIKDARVELGQELVPVMETLYTDVFPKLISGVRGLIGVWQGWEVLITGTTQAIKDMNAQFNAQFSPENQKLLRQMQDLQQQRNFPADVVARYHQEAPNMTDAQLRRRFPGFAEAQDQLNGIDKDLADLMAQFRANIRAETQRQAAQRHSGRGGTDTALGNQPPPDTSTTNPPPAPAPAAGSKTDPLVAEFQAIQADISNRLKAGFEAGKIAEKDYEDYLRAHAARINKLLEQATTPQQSAAGYAALKADRDAIQQLSDARVKAAQDALKAEQDYRDGLNATKAEIAKNRAETQAALDRYRQEEAQKRLEDAQQQVAQQEGIAARRQEIARNQAATQAALDQYQAENAKAAQDKIVSDAEQAAQQQAGIEARRQEIARNRKETQDALTRYQQENEQARIKNAQEAAQQEAALEEYRKNVILKNRRETQVYLDSLKTPQALLDEKQATVELTKVKQQLGMVTREDLVKAYQDELAWMERMLQQLPEGSDAWNAYAQAILDATGALVKLHSEGEKPIPKPGATAAVTGYDAYKGSLQSAQQQLEGIALEFPKQLVKGIESGDVAGALKTALGDASDFFVNQMIEGILGPIAKNLASSISSSMLNFGGKGGASLTGAGVGLGVAALALGFLLPALFPGPGQSHRTGGFDNGPGSSGHTGSAPAVQYTASTTINLESKFNWRDPAFLAELRSVIREETINVIDRLPGSKAGQA